MNDFEIIQKLYEDNNIDQINQIIKSNSINDNNYLLIEAAYNGYLDIVKVLVPLSDPKANKSKALKYAAYYGYLEIVELLLPHSDPKANNSQALRLAAENGHLDIVKLLIPHSDCKAEDSYALRRASENGHLEVVKLLLSHSNIESAIKQLKENIYPEYQENINKSLETINNYFFQKQKELLLNEINEEINNSSNKSKRKI